MKTKKLPYRGAQIAKFYEQLRKLERRCCSLRLKIHKLERSSRAFRTRAEYDLWEAYFI